MDSVFWIVCGILAVAGIALMAAAIFKLVMFVGEKIESRLDDRRHRNTSIEWSKDGRTGRVISDKPLPQIEATKPKQPHKHMWKFNWNHRDVIYHFTCECGEGAQIRIDQFWGSPTIRSERALKRAELLYATKKAYEKERERTIAAFQDYQW